MSIAESTCLVLDGEPTTLYRMWGDNHRLLYVGITKRGYGRMYNHARMSEWWRQVITISLEHYPSREDAMAAEARAIHREKPIYNIQHQRITERQRRYFPEMVPVMPVRASASDGAAQFIGAEFTTPEGTMGVIVDEPYAGLMLVAEGESEERRLVRAYDMAGWSFRFPVVADG